MQESQFRATHWLWPKILTLPVIAVGAALMIWFYTEAPFQVDPLVWFKPAYYQQFIPLYLAALMLIAGVMAALPVQSANAWLVVAGLTTSEELLLHHFGLAVSALPINAMALLFPTSAYALLMGYSNVLKRKPLSVKDILFGLIGGMLALLIPRWL